MNARQLAALVDPLQSFDLDHIARHRHVALAGDRVLVCTILAVDR